MKNLSLNVKFVFVLGIFITGAVTISIVGNLKMGVLHDEIDRIISKVVPRMTLSGEIATLAAELRNQEKAFVLEPTKEGMAKVDTALNGIEKSIRDKSETLKPMLVMEDSRKDLEEATKQLDQWRAISTELRELALADKNEEAMALARGKSAETLRSFNEHFDTIVERNTKALAQDDIDTDILYRDARNLIIGVSASAILLGVMLAFLILRSVNRAIDTVIQGLNDSSNQVTAAAQQIASSSEQLSQGATEQASSLEETSSAVEEMNSMVQRNADSARQSSEISQASGDSANRGKRVVENMKQAMRDIDSANSNIMQQTTESNLKISEIVKVIAEIGNKTKVINDIVFQTKLLSFNASVEAARAGEHGKGFAVVAEEVGNLAQMSGNAAKEISSMLDSSIQKVESIVRDTKTSVEKLIAESKEKVEVGSRVATDCGSVLDEIVSNVSQVTQMSLSISTASDEQARGVSEITKAVSQLDQMTQQNAAASEETASAAEELSAQAESMHGVVQTLILTIKGGESHTTERAPSVKVQSRPKAHSSPSHSPKGVIHLGTKPSKKSGVPATSSPTGLKLASGSDIIPSHDDPRFKEI